MQRRGGHNKESFSNGKPVTAVATEAITNRLNSLGITEGGAQSSVPVSEPPTIEAEKTPNEQKNANSSELFKGNLLESFTVDNSTFSRAQVRATFYPKFENEKSDQEVAISPTSLSSVVHDA